MQTAYKYTHQGVRDLNDLGGKRVNGKKRDCPHFPDEVYVYDHVERRDGNEKWLVAVLACSACDQVLGPEDELEDKKPR